jgi:hypothetical protein
MVAQVSKPFRQLFKHHDAISATAAGTTNSN